MTEQYAEQVALIARLQRDLDEATESLHEAMIEDFPIKVGDVVKDRNGREYLVHALLVRWGRVEIMGRKKTKTGWHSSAFDMSWRDVEKVAT